MPLDVARLRDSELASNETPDACWAAVLIWAASWHQIPAASIPNDETWIAKVAGYSQRGKIDTKAWNKVRAGALRGWVECSDGRLYHAVVAEKALDAWQAKLQQRWRTECGRIKKHNDRHPGANVPKPTFEEWMSQGCPLGHLLYVPGDSDCVSPGSPPDFHSKRQGEGQGQGQGELIKASVPIGTGGEPPSEEAEKPRPKNAAEEKVEAWHAAKSLLKTQGMPIAQCGTFIGKLAKDYGEEVVYEVIRKAVVEQPAEAVAWMKAACMASKKEGGKGILPWHATDDGVIAKGLEMTPPLKPQPGENGFTFKSRVVAAIENGGTPPVQPSRLALVAPAPTEARNFKPEGVPPLVSFVQKREAE